MLHRRSLWVRVVLLWCHACLASASYAPYLEQVWSKVLPHKVLTLIIITIIISLSFLIGIPLVNHILFQSPVGTLETLSHSLNSRTNRTVRDDTYHLGTGYSDRVRTSLIVPDD